jgi:secondary thiamine-phosphate synthase enzyme
MGAQSRTAGGSRAGRWRAKPMVKCRLERRFPRPHGMHQHQTTLQVTTRGRGLVEITSSVADWLRATGIRDGLLTLFIRHTSASLLIQENADPDVQADLERFLARLVPDGDPLFEHRSEGPDDMPAHVRSALGQVHLAVPVQQCRMALGTWQGIYLHEHRRHGQTRLVVLHAIGE